MMTFVLAKKAWWPLGLLLLISAVASARKGYSQNPLQASSQTYHGGDLLPAASDKSQKESHHSHHQKKDQKGNKNGDDSEFHDVASYGGQKGYSTHEEFEKKDGTKYGFGDSRAFGKGNEGKSKKGGSSSAHARGKGHQHHQHDGDHGGYGSGSSHYNHGYYPYFHY